MIDQERHADTCIKIFKRLFGNKELTGVEIGVQHGLWTAYILNNLKNIKKIYCIDSWKCYPDGFYEQLNNQETHNRNYITFLERIKDYADKIDILQMASDEAVSYITEPLDFVYIDGCHEKSFVERDIKNYYPLVREGGFFGGHDYSEAGVIEMVNKYFPDKQLPGDTIWWIQKQKQ